MRVKNFTAFILIFMLFFFCTVNYSQDMEELKELSKRVKILEEQKESLSKISERLKDESAANSKRFEHELQTFSDRFDALKEDIDTRQKRNDIILAALIVVLALLGIGGVGSLWKLKKFVDNKTREYAEKMIEENFRKERDKLLELIEKKDEEIRLRNEKDILVLTPKGADDEFIRDFFDKMKFKTPDFGSLGELPNLKKYHLILFNNEDGKFDHDQISEIIKQTGKDVVCFYYGSIRYGSGKVENKVAFANYPFQLYGNLINALRYQSLLK